MTTTTVDEPLRICTFSTYMRLKNRLYVILLSYSSFPDSVKTFLILYCILCRGVVFSCTWRSRKESFYCILFEILWTCQLTYLGSLKWVIYVPFRFKLPFKIQGICIDTVCQSNSQNSCCKQSVNTILRIQEYL